MKKFFTCITFDVDFTDYVNKSFIDEFSEIVSDIVQLFKFRKEIKATWFIRIDSQIEEIFGYADYVFKKHKYQIKEITELGHEFGWHPHFYIRKNRRYIPDQDIFSIKDNILKYASLAKLIGMNAVRMGMGFHRNETMNLISDLSFEIDSSAVPRPRYKWDVVKKDWSCTPLVPYFPSKYDYRKTGRDILKILEIPISVLPIKTSYDRKPIKRIVNFAYNPSLLIDPLRKWVSKYSHLVTVTHPYELKSKINKNDLIPFDFKVFKDNLDNLTGIVKDTGKDLIFTTISDFGKIYKNKIQKVI